MITFNKVFLLTPEGIRIMISRIDAWGAKHEKYKCGASWISVNGGIEREIERLRKG